MIVPGAGSVAFGPWTSTRATPRLPTTFFQRVRQAGARFTEDVFWIRVAAQSFTRFHKVLCHCEEHQSRKTPEYLALERPLVCSTSRFGIGQEENSNRTPLGLHRVARKIGDGWPTGTIFRGRQFQGYTWQCDPEAKITDRILWLEGLEEGFNRGGKVDSFRRYIYIHGTGDETTLGRPATCGCTHLADRDLVPLFDTTPVGTMVWISER